MPSKIRRRVIPLLLCLMAVFALTGCGPLLELNQKYTHPEIYVNYGTAVSTDISEYVNMDTLSKEEQKYVKKNSSVVYHGNKVSGHKYDRPGTYPLTIYYEDQVYRKYQVTIKDMEKPKFKKAKDVYIFKDTELTEYELQDLLKGMFKATDNSGKVKLKLYKGNIINAGVWSDYSLYYPEIATFGEDEVYNQADAQGFITLFGLPVKVQAKVNEKNGKT